jgi:hypothetical protein
MVDGNEPNDFHRHPLICQKVMRASLSGTQIKLKNAEPTV